MVNYADPLPLIGTDNDGFANWMGTTANASSSINMDDVLLAMRQLEQMHRDEISSGVKAANRVHCDQCDRGAAYTDKPRDGFIVCEHILAELQKLPHSQTPHLAQLMGLALYQWEGWFAAIPDGHRPAIGSHGQATWKAVPTLFGIPIVESDTFPDLKEGDIYLWKPGT